MTPDVMRALNAERRQRERDIVTHVRVDLTRWEIEDGVYDRYRIPGHKFIEVRSKGAGSPYFFVVEWTPRLGRMLVLLTRGRRHDDTEHQIRYDDARHFAECRVREAWAAYDGTAP